jgi:hypothetical protein
MSCCAFRSAIGKTLGSIFLLIVAAACLAGCQKKEQEVKGYYEGPMKPKGAIQGQQGP